MSTSCFIDRIEERTCAAVVASVASVVGLFPCFTGAPKAGQPEGHESVRSPHPLVLFFHCLPRGSLVSCITEDRGTYRSANRGQRQTLNFCHTFMLLGGSSSVARRCLQNDFTRYKRAFQAIRNDIPNGQQLFEESHELSLFLANPSHPKQFIFFTLRSDGAPTRQWWSRTPCPSCPVALDSTRPLPILSLADRSALVSLRPSAPPDAHCSGTGRT